MAILDPLLQALSGVGYALDTPGAYARGLLGGRPGERLSGREMLESWGMGENTPGLDLGDALGFGAEMLLDPLNLLGAGLLGKTAQAAGAARRFNAVQDAARAAGAMPEEVAALTKLRTAEGPQVFSMPEYRLAPGQSPIIPEPETVKLGIPGGGNYTENKQDVWDLAIGPSYSEGGTANSVPLYVDARNPVNALDAIPPQDFQRMEAIAGPLREEAQVEALFSGRADPFATDEPSTLREYIQQIREARDEDDLFLGFSAPRPHVTWNEAIAGVNQYTKQWPEVMRRMGYDALLDPGIGRLEVFNRSQVYPAQIAYANHPVPRTSPLLASLLGYNTAMLPERG